MCRVHPIRPKLPEGKVHHIYCCYVFGYCSQYPHPFPLGRPTVSRLFVMRCSKGHINAEQRYTSKPVYSWRYFIWKVSVDWMSSTFIWTVDHFLYNSRSCCVDEVAAEHVQADCIIHFGPACLAQWVNKTSSVIVYSVKGFVILALQRWKYLPKLSKHPQQCLSVIAIYFARVSHCIWKLLMSTSIILVGQDGFQCSMCLDGKVLMYFTVWLHLGSSILTERQTYWCFTTQYTCTV